MNIDRFIQDYIIKRRIIFCACSVSNSSYSVLSGLGYKIMEQMDIFNDPSVRSLLPKAVNLNELEKDSLFCMVCQKESSGDPVGVGFLLVPRTRSLWYDNVQLRPGESRLIGDYVIPEYRGKGIGSALNHGRIQWAMKNLDVHCTTVIVESYRATALKAQSRYSKKCGSNFLIKFFKRNVISICFGSPYRGVWYVGPGRLRRWHVE